MKQSKKYQTHLSNSQEALFQKFMIEEMGLWEIVDSQVQQTSSPFVPLNTLKSRFKDYQLKNKGY